jgi:hypothetical protein
MDLLQATGSCATWQLGRQEFSTFDDFEDALWQQP